MRASELKENFVGQLNGVVNDLNALEGQIAAKKEIAIKLKGAIEALDILISGETPEVKEDTPQEETK